MQNINIQVDENLLPILQKLADQRNITPEFYLTDYIRAHLISQYKADIVQMVTSKTLPDLVVMETAIVAVDQDVKARESASFVAADAGEAKSL